MTHGSNELAPHKGRGINQIVALAFGAVYTVVGIAGFFVAENFVGQEGDELIGFQVNNLHNIVHLLIGVALIAAAKRLDTARGANLAIGVTYVALAIAGPFLTGTDANILALNTADHWLHAVSGVVLAAVALLADKRARAHA